MGIGHELNFLLRITRAKAVMMFAVPRPARHVEHVDMIFMDFPQKNRSGDNRTGAMAMSAVAGSFKV